MIHCHDLKFEAHMWLDLQTIKNAMKPTREKLKDLCAKVEVLENEVITLRDDMERHTDPLPSSNVNLHEPVSVATQSEGPKSPPDDW
ncbi:hypothetical protein HAX54_023520 [Datura stramonium]|uniref:Uncharacterized protein n=1 Tax=Datura stramonium TaxID=4076 RepID=A0ABS8UWC6_DATST|nr:hypothetical protein [Datura stramonium]